MRHPLYKYVLAFVDAIALIIAVLGSVLLRSVMMSPVRLSVSFEPLILMRALAIASLGVIIFKVNALYKLGPILRLRQALISVGMGLITLTFILAILSFFLRVPILPDSRLEIVGMFVIGLPIVILFRFGLFKSVFDLLSNIQIYTRKAIVVGSGSLARYIATDVEFAGYFGLKILGFFDDGFEIGSKIHRGLGVLGSRKAAPELVREQSVREVFIALEEADHATISELIDSFRDTQAVVKIVSPSFDVVAKKITVEEYSSFSAVVLQRFKPHPLQIAGKRIVDTLLAVLGIMALAPVFATIAMAIRLDSRGPIFYRQVRIGKDGREFMFYKFRSMRVGSDSDEGRREQVLGFIKGGNSGHEGTKKIVNKRQITKVGAFLRKTSLDELPQLYNVLKGDMSLVGPRPCLPYEWEGYSDWHKKRLSITPGCTGMWQVYGRSEVDFNEMVILDLYYINNASILLDLELIFRTIPVMVFGRGAG